MSVLASVVVADSELDTGGDGFGRGEVDDELERLVGVEARVHDGERVAVERDGGRHADAETRGRLLVAARLEHQPIGDSDAQRHGKQDEHVGLEEHARLEQLAVQVDGVVGLG